MFIYCWQILFNLSANHFIKFNGQGYSNVPFFSDALIALIKAPSTVTFDKRRMKISFLCVTCEKNHNCNWLTFLSSSPSIHHSIQMPPVDSLSVSRKHRQYVYTGWDPRPQGGICLHSVCTVPSLYNNILFYIHLKRCQFYIVKASLRNLTRRIY